MCLGPRLTRIIKPLVYALKLGCYHSRLGLGLGLAHQSGLLIINLSSGSLTSSCTLLVSLSIPDKTPT